MRLKKLEINGFKSFIDKSQIVFPEGICAIVGPNGCGKSNIIDALLWVMGEQSAKKLRGKSMEDLIFAGTPANHSLNFAEVSLTVENHKEDAGVEFDDYTEIMLTRRICRSGESEYLLNKHPCRLKDIHNLFEKSSSGHKTYSIITQGNIGAITEAGAAERRFFIEEAAGVAIYKTSKTEAVKKIDAAKENLLRVTDIISEVKRQMTSLKRQAEKANRFKEYRQQIKILEILISIFNYNKINKDIKKNEALLTSLKNSEIKNSSELLNIEALCENVRFEKEEKEKELSEKKNKKFEVHRKIDRFETELPHLEKDYRTTTASLISDKDSEAEFTAKNQSLLSEIEDIKKRLKEIDLNLARTYKSAKEEEYSAKDTINFLSDLKNRLEKNKSELMKATAAEARIKNMYHTAVSGRDSLTKRFKTIEQEKRKAGITKKELEIKVKEAKNKKASSADHIKQLSEQIKEEYNILENNEKQLSEQIKKNFATDIKKEKLKSELIVLTKIRDDFRWYKEGVRAIMKSSKICKGDIKQLVADIIEPYPGFETATEAALGEALQYIVVNKREDSFEYIDFLAKNSFGRSGFIFFSSICQSLANDSNNSNKLINHIKIKKGFEKICGLLFQNIYLAETIEDAALLWDKKQGEKIFVTKNGEIILDKGIIIGGSADNLPNILIKKQEIKNIEARIEETKADIYSEKKILAEIESKTDISEKMIDAFNREKNKADLQKQETEKSLYIAEESLKHSLKYFKITELEEERLAGEQSDIDDEIKKQKDALIDIEEKTENIKNLIENIASQIEKVSYKGETFNKIIVDKKLEITSLKAKKESEASTLKRLFAFYKESKNRLQKLSEQTAEKKNRLVLIEDQINNGKKNLFILYDNLNGTENLIKNFEANYQSVDLRLKEKKKEADSVKSELEKIYRKIREIEPEQSRKKATCENINERIKERYHKSLDEFKETIFNNPFNYAVKQETELFEHQKKLTELKDKITSGFNEVNLRAIEEYEELKTRYDFLTAQKQDINKAIEDLYKVVKKINNITRERFIKTFNLINENLGVLFPKLFEGGDAKLILTEPDNILETGVEIVIHPPGKKLARLTLLSGGEKVLCAIAFIFSIFFIKPASFCLLDEIDAPLDEANIFRFNRLLKVIGEKTQIVMVTHNKRSMEFADTLFGVTMGKKGVSKIVSVKVASNAR
ncbi:MAG: chromosome segregation protein SMC [Deltaproteobacteria bacterium]|nr:chromosome segregation protein SMC [Deltaproteobacteria bacterium]